MIDDESTDDELGVNLQLAQKLQINKAQCRNRMKHPRKCTKEYKQFYNEKKKELHDDGLTANIFPNTGLPVQGGWFVAETPSPYHLGNKKRQNGDRSNVGGAKSKRTCLSEKFFEGLENANGNKGHVNELPLTSIQKRYSKEVENNAGHSKKVAMTGAKKYFKSVRSNHECSPKDISPDETYENHLASKTPFYSGKPNLIKAKNDYRKYEKKVFERPISDGLSLPSTSKVEHTDLANFPGSNRSKPVHRGVQFIDSDSDDENMCLKQGVLKGGGQTNYGLYRSRRKAHRILDTDDSDDSNWIYNYRNCHSGFSPSDSNGSNEGIKSLHLEASNNCNDHCSSAEQSKQSSSSNSTDSLTALARNISFSKAGSNSSECESRCNGDTLGTLARKSKNFCKQNRKKLSHNEIPTKKRVHQFHDSNSQNTSLARLRRRQKSPHRCVSSHSRSLRCKKNVVEHPHTSPSSSSKLSSDEQNDLSLTARFPDVFDAEEYFTANSSSVTESSNESSVAWGVSVTSTLRKNGAGAALGYANVGDSSENEISVIFSSNPPHTEENVIQLRGSVRNKRSACGHEHSLDVVSLSPDPVELVRQMEDDERLARSLQAQFDAEANGSEEPNSQISHSPLSSEENDIIDSVDGLNIRRLPSQIDVVRPNHGSARSRHFSRGRRRGRQRGGSRHSAHIPDVLSLRNIPGVRILDSPDDPWTWQFARMLGLGTTLSTGIDSDFDDYEVLLEIAEDIGEVIQRGLHKTEVNRLPTRQYTNPNTARGLEEVSHKRTDLNKECQVCLCDYEHGDVLRILPCFHEFHIPCIDPWLKINRTCPVCRVVVNFGE